MTNATLDPSAAGHPYDEARTDVGQPMSLINALKGIIRQLQLGITATIAAGAEIKITDGTNDALVTADGALYTSLQSTYNLTFASPTSVSVSNSSTQILASAATRKAAIIVNDSDSVIYLGIGAAAVLNAGIRLNPNGGSFVFDMTMNATQAVNGIASVAGKNVTVHTAT